MSEQEPHQVPQQLEQPHQEPQQNPATSLKSSAPVKVPEAGDSTRGSRRKTLVVQGSRYLIVGFSSVAIELTLFFVLYEIASIDLVVSNVIAITLASAYNFFMSRSWTFKCASSLPRSIVLYLLLFAWNQFFSSWALVALLDLGLHALVAKVITMAAIVCWNFVLYRKVVFK